MSDTNQNLHENKMKNEAERLYEKFRDQMDVLDGSVLAKVRGGSPLLSDYWALGKQLEQYEMYQSVCEEEGNVGLLGKIPSIAYDVITAVHSASIIPVIASVQPIEEERGTVYFKNIRSGSTRGSQTDGDVVLDPRSGSVTPSGYAGAKVEGEVGVNTGGGPGTSYNFTVAGAPVKPESMRISIEDDAATYAIDDGKGVLLGVGVSGTVNYSTGLVNLTFAVAPAANKDIYADYQTNFELSNDLPQIDSFFDSKSISARIYALKGTFGMLQSYGMRKRFGMIAEDELAKDLVIEVNREIGGDIIRKLVANQQGNTQFSKTPPSAEISYFEHKQTFKDSLADAEAVMLGNAGRGTISTIIAGREVCAIMQTLPGWQKLTDGNTLGTHVYGTLDGVTVVRVPEANLLDPKKAVLMWKGQSPFDAAAVYSPYMPLTVTATLPAAPNPLGSMKAAAVWAGVDVLVENYITGFEVTV